MSDRVYFSFIEQTMHYFSRPHEQVPTAPLQCAAAWRGADMPTLEDMAYRLSTEEIDEVRTAVASTMQLGRESGTLTVRDFPLPRLEPRIKQWRLALSEGVGFQVIRGVPIEQWTKEECELFFWCFGLHIGRPGEQNPQGDLVGHVLDTGVALNEQSARLYKTASKIDFHCDAADVVGLLCLNKARQGGQSRIASSVSVFNELLIQRPDLAARLFKPMNLDIRDREVNSDDGILPVQPCCYSNGVLRTFYHSDYLRSVVRHDVIQDLDTIERALLDSYDAIALNTDIYLDMDLEPGDIQLLSNHSVIHSRTNYQDYDDPTQRRHLLRLWLSLD